MITLTARKKEILRYAVAGAVTTLLNVLLYKILLDLGVRYNISNLIAIVVTKAFAYAINKIYVFKSKTNNIFNLFKEIFRFIVARATTGVIDYFGVILFVEIFFVDKFFSKCIITAIVIILNYFFSKFSVFK